MLAPGARDACTGDVYGLAGFVGSCAVKYQGPVGVFPLFAIRNRTATMSSGDMGLRVTVPPVIGSITPTDKMRTERSTVFGARGEVGIDGAIFAGVSAGVGVDIGAGEAEVTDFSRTICRVAFPCARVPEVAVGMKIIEIGTLKEEVPERVGISERDVFVPGTVYAAPQGITLCVPFALPGVFNIKLLWH